MVTITVNGQAVEAPEGATVLEAATAAGVRIPTLCYLKDLNCIGSCRACLVDVEGEGLAASCNTAVREGMVVRTDTPQVAVARRANLQAIMDDHRALCATCVRQDTCALRDLASTFNLTDAPGPLPEPAPWDADFPLQRDSSKCIKCMRCVAICEKVQHCAVWDFTGVGPSTKIIVRDNLPIAEAGCALCGQCITHCPTGALTAFDPYVDKIGMAVVDEAECQLYGISGTCNAPCIDACEWDALSLDENGRLVVDEKRCNGCGACEYVCPTSAYRNYDASNKRGINVEVWHG